MRGRIECEELDVFVDLADLPLVLGQPSEP
jgi:hypothetical protein